jgi:hypothetical protein
MGTFVYPSGPGVVVEVSQGGFTAHSSVSNVYSNYPGHDDLAKMGFVWAGNCYLPVGLGIGAGYGYLSYNPAQAKFDHAIGRANLQMHVPFADRIAVFGSSIVSRLMNPYAALSKDVTTAFGQIKDYVILGGSIIAHTGTSIHVWSFPFGGYPTNNALSLNRLAVHKGVVYGVRIATGGSSYLYKWNGGTTWVIVGTFIPTNQTNLRTTGATSCSFFSKGGKLWLVCAYGNTGTNRVRCFEINPATGAATEDSSYIPAGWQIPSTDSGCRLFEVIDDLGATRKVYLILAGGVTPGGWECSEFNNSSPAFDSSGGHTVYPYCGILWSPSGKGAHIESAADSAPSDHVSMQIGVANIPGNGSVNIDPRFRLLTDIVTAPPYIKCSEKGGVGSEGKLALASKPALTTIAELADLFDMSGIDENLWEVAYPRLNVNAGGNDWGYGPVNWEPLYEIFNWSGAGVQLGRLAVDKVEQFVGGGIKSKWWVGGAFEFNVRFSNLAALRTGPTYEHYVGMLVRVARGMGYLIRICRNPATALIARGGFVNGGAFLETADLGVPVDSMWFRIARSAGNVWTVTIDPLGSPIDATPAPSINFTDPVQIVIFGGTQDTWHWNGSDPGVHIAEFNPVGAGSLLHYDSERKHFFAWDHITDLGINISDTVELTVDAET